MARSPFWALKKLLFTLTQAVAYKVDFFGNSFFLCLAHQLFLSETHTIRETCCVTSQRFAYKEQRKSELLLVLRM